MELSTKTLKILFVPLALTFAAIAPASGQEAEATQPREQAKTEYWPIACHSGTQEKQFSTDTTFVSLRFDYCACALTEEDARIFAKAILYPQDYTDWLKSHVNLTTGYPEITLSFVADRTATELTLYCYDIGQLGELVMNDELR